MIKQFSFNPITYKKLSLLIENQIKQRILAEEFLPGDRLPSEGEIGRQFGVSLVTVREALKGLETYGLVEKRKGKGGGVFVSELRSESVKIQLYHFLNQKKFSSKDLSEIRMIIEPVACRIASKRITKTIIDKLDKNIEHCDQLIERAGDNFNEEDFLELEENNIAFHSLIGEATQNPVLVLTTDYILDFLFNFKKITLIPNREFSHGVIRDHRLILSRLKKKNGPSAEKAMVGHLKHVENYLTEHEGEKNTGTRTHKTRKEEVNVHGITRRADKRG